MGHSTGISIEDARLHQGSPVRISPASGHESGGSKHWSRGKLVGVGRKTVTVELAGGGRTARIEVDPKHIKLWHAKLDDYATQKGDPDVPQEKPEHAHPMKLTEKKPEPPVAAEEPAAVAAAPEPAARRIEDVLEELTRLTNIAKSNRRDIDEAERTLEAADAAIRNAQVEKQKAEQGLLDQMQKQETLKSKIRVLRGKLDAVIDEV